MANVNITRIGPGYAVPIPPRIRVSDLARSSEFPAYEIFLERGGGTRNPLNDWIQAKREKFGHARANRYEDDTSFRADFQVPGFSPDEILVGISPGQLGVHARRTGASALPRGKEAILLREFADGEAYRQLHFHTLIDPVTIEIEFEVGVLHVTVRKAHSEDAPEIVPGEEGAVA